MGGQGVRIGLSTNPVVILWTAGFLGAIRQLSSLPEKVSLDHEYLEIKHWLQWLRQAAYSQFITFKSNQIVLQDLLISNKLDWISCHSNQFDKLREKMGDKLGVTTLPNSREFKAFTWPNLYFIYLGSDSSSSQRAMAIEYIKSNTNPIAQRELMLSKLDFLPANKNVSIPIQSANILRALNISYREQTFSYSAEWPGILRYIFPRYSSVNRVMIGLTDGNLTVEQFMKILTNDAIQ